METGVSYAVAKTAHCCDPPPKRGTDVVHRSTAVELTSVPCDLSVFLAGFKNRILHQVCWKERNMRAVHPHTQGKNHLLKCLGKICELYF